MTKKKTILSISGILLALFVLTALIGLSGCNKQVAEGGQYHCPMHPTYISDRPGDCPICGMRVVPIENKTEKAKPAAQIYACPMHPEVHSTNPNDRCSKCGMKLEPVKSEAVPVKGKAAGQTEQAKGKYYCPMCPGVYSDKPDDRCPECGMFLEPVPATLQDATNEPSVSSPSDSTPADTENPKILFYRNPMDPNVTSPVPAKDSMGMDYVPVYENEVSVSKNIDAELAPVEMTAEGQRLAGIQVAEATQGELTFSTRTVGAVNVDETRVRHMHTKIEGYIEKLYANFTGQLVQNGEPILAIYSPELLSSQEEYLRALEISAKFRNSDVPEVRRGGEDLLKAARRRLELFDVPKNFIAQLEKTHQPQRTVTLNAPVSGFVTSKSAFEGMMVEPGMELFTITDLSSVWIEADFYEYEAQSVQIGQEARLTLPYDPSVELSGKVTYVYPYLNKESRTLKVRFDFNNQNLALKPGMYVNVSLEINSGKGVIIPDSAVMNTGLRHVVFVESQPGRFDPREIKVGMRNNNQALILEGIKPGELVVVRANFLLDSESRLRAAISGMSGHQH